MSVIRSARTVSGGTLVSRGLGLVRIQTPAPDGAAPPFAWTFQPAGATYSPPVAIDSVDADPISLANLTISGNVGDGIAIGTGGCGRGHGLHFAGPRLRFYVRLLNRLKQAGWLRRVVRQHV